MENTTIESLLGIIALVENRLTEISDWANSENISGFRDHPLTTEWKTLSSFRIFCVNAAIEKTRGFAKKNGFDLEKCFRP